MAPVTDVKKSMEERNRIKKVIRERVSAFEKLLPTLAKERRDFICQTIEDLKHNLAYMDAFEQNGFQPTSYNNFHVV